MNDFIRTNFPELLLTFLVIVIGCVLIFAIHWHDDKTVTWAQNLIGGIVLALAAVVNSLKHPQPAAVNTTMTSTESVRGDEPQGDK